MKTLLRKFQLKKMEGYSAEKFPGFSAVKYQALLFSLYGYKVKDMAKELGISYGVLRKWRSEKDFKHLFKGHCEEFAKDFIKEFKEVYKKDFRKFSKNPKLSRHLSTYRQFKDYNVYGDELRVTLAAALVDSVRRGDMPPEEAVVACTLLRPPMAFMVQVERVLARNLLEKTINELKKGGIKASKFKCAIFSLGLVKKYFD